MGTAPWATGERRQDDGKDLIERAQPQQRAKPHGIAERERIHERRDDELAARELHDRGVLHRDVEQRLDELRREQRQQADEQVDGTADREPKRRTTVNGRASRDRDERRPRFDGRACGNMDRPDRAGLVARISFIIFIASITATTSPSFTLAP